MNRTYLQLSATERHVIAECRQLGLSLRRIARLLQRSPSTISRECRRNLFRNHYRSPPAHVQALRRRHQKRGGFFSDPEQQERLRQLLWRKWSPDQIAGREKRKDRRFASRSTIYRYLKGKPHLRRWLRGESDKRKQDKKRERIHSSRLIDERPSIVDERGRFGDWEGDTIRGPQKSKACVATFVERSTRYLVAGKMEKISSQDLNWRAEIVLDGLPVLSLTVDHGMEFGGFKKLEKSLSTEVYFGHPRSPWERGLNENTNGLLRQYFPKGTDFSRLQDLEILEAVIELNHRPRKCLDYQTPQEALDEALLHLT